ncbi:helix-turn-helix transcriptional regulator [Aquabacterium sp. J223]|uniref:helix-turn-helix transcriptional regulator n=1 Tax=Aquabacterium sp. J223 TaxID=2898431 RepID=UPI0021AE0103|nr:helix-turn-helix transcriptional regulator [Aquabacterium sp. J223]UUX95777.1 helix-turn-helix transcriptional regulator [Aquabacterium sp. J223]
MIDDMHITFERNVHAGTRSAPAWADRQPESSADDLRQRPSIQLLEAMLDEVDLPMLLVNVKGVVVHMNRVARLSLDAGPICLDRDNGVHVLRVKSAQPGLGRRLAAALASSYRQVVCAEEGDRSVIASVVPINQEFGADDRLALLILGRRRPVQPLAVDWFARCNGLTPSETRVLTMLCSGLSPHDIAKQNGVAVSTIRTQVASIRTKTATRSMRDLVAKVAALPPMVGLTRTVS